VSGGLLALVCGVGAAHLVAYYTGRPALAGILKAIPILALAATVWTSPGTAGPSYAGLVTTGLVLSAVGDVSLVFPMGFLAGLSAFFAAHCCYVAAFAPEVAATATTLWAAVALGAFAAAMLRYLWPYVGRLRLPVVVYVTALSAMAWCAVARASAPDSSAAEAAAAIGAVSFLVSDGVLAVNRFARPFRGAHAVVMVTYYLAQTLIARSALYQVPGSNI
jgi:alkenylglycerophosphocholine hydrolase